MLFFVIGIQRRFFRSQNCLDISWFLFRQLLDGQVGRHRLYSGRDEYHTKKGFSVLKLFGYFLVFIPPTFGRTSWKT